MQNYDAVLITRSVRKAEVPLRASGNLLVLMRWHFLLTGMQKSQDGDDDGDVLVIYRMWRCARRSPIVEEGTEREYL